MCLLQCNPQQDADGDGFLAYADFLAALESFGEGFERGDAGGVGGDDDVALLLRRLDTNGDGKVNWREFLRFCSPADMLAGAVRQHLRARVESGESASFYAIFHAMDTDRNGVISRREFEDALGTLGLAGRVLGAGEVTALIERFTASRDGAIDYREFLEFCDPGRVLRMRQEEAARAAERAAKEAAAAAALADDASSADGDAGDGT